MIRFNLDTANNQRLVTVISSAGDEITLRVQDKHGHNRAVAKLDRLGASALAAGIIHFLDTIPAKDYS